MKNKSVLEACKRVVDKINSMTPDEIVEKYGKYELGPLGRAMLELHEIEYKEKEQNKC